MKKYKIPRQPRQQEPSPIGIRGLRPWTQKEKFQYRVKKLQKGVVGKIKYAWFAIVFLFCVFVLRQNP